MDEIPSIRTHSPTPVPQPLLVRLHPAHSLPVSHFHSYLCLFVFSYLLMWVLFSALTEHEATDERSDDEDDNEDEPEAEDKED